MSQPKSRRKRLAQQRRTTHREAKRAVARAERKSRPVPKSERVPNAMPASRQPPRGVPKLVRGAIERMIARHKLVHMPRPVEREQEAA